MKNITRKIAAVGVAMTMAVLFVACDIETSDNGKLDGYWHLERIDSLASGGQLDLAQRRIFWAIQAKLINVRDVDYNSNGCYLRFRQTADSLVIYDPYANHWHQDQEDGGDIPITDATLLNPYGINALEVHYQKESLSGSKMVLKDDVVRLYFTKF